MEWWLWGSGVFAVLAQLASCYGICDQLLLTYRRKSIEGLSLVDAESRIWGKVPWVLYACSCKSIDFPLLASSFLGTSIGLVTLSQFFFYTKNRNIKLYLRFALQPLLVVLTVVVVVHGVDILRESLCYLSALPVIFGLVAIFFGSWAQITMNYRRRSTFGVSYKRYMILLSLNVLWLFYGIAKAKLYGMTEGWTIIVSSLLGGIFNGVIVFQILKYSDDILILHTIKIEGAHSSG